MAPACDDTAKRIEMARALFGLPALEHGELMMLYRSDRVEGVRERDRDTLGGEWLACEGRVSYAYEIT